MECIAFEFDIVLWLRCPIKKSKSPRGIFFCRFPRKHLIGRCVYYLALKRLFWREMLNYCLTLCSIDTVIKYFDRIYSHGTALAKLPFSSSSKFQVSITYCFFGILVLLRSLYWSPVTIFCA